MNRNSINATGSGADSSVAILIKSERSRLGFTQEEFAQKVGVGLRFLRELEQGKATHRIDKVNQVLGVLGYELGPVRITNSRKERERV